MTMHFHREDTPTTRRCAICGLSRVVVLGERCPDDAAPFVDPDLLDEGPIAGRFRLIERVAHGAFADVYAATDEHADRTLGQLIAIKRLQPALRQETDARARFEREGELLERLHATPGVVALIERGYTDAGDPFLALEYLDGQTLEDVLASYGRLTVGAAARIVLALLQALDGVHAAGLVHRDLKPSNIMMLAIDDRARLRLLDFGIARDPARSDKRLTAPSRTVGTPNYMSPEQWSSAAVDERSDLYSAGVVFYHLLAGRLPYDGDERQIAHQHRTAPPPHIDPALDVPPGVVAVLHRALHKVPELRFPSAAHFYDALAAELGLPGFAGLDTTAPLPDLAATRPTPAAPRATARLAPTPGLDPSHRDPAHRDPNPSPAPAHLAPTPGLAPTPALAPTRPTARDITPTAHENRPALLPAPAPLITRRRLVRAATAAALTFALALALTGLGTGLTAPDAPMHITAVDDPPPDWPPTPRIPAIVTPPPTILEHGVDDPTLLASPPLAQPSLTAAAAAATITARTKRPPKPATPACKKFDRILQRCLDR